MKNGTNNAHNSSDVRDWEVLKRSLHTGKQWWLSWLLHN